MRHLPLNAVNEAFDDSRPWLGNGDGVAVHDGKRGNKNRPIHCQDFFLHVGLRRQRPGPPAPPVHLESKVLNPIHLRIRDPMLHNSRNDVDADTFDTSRAQMISRTSHASSGAAPPKYSHHSPLKTWCRMAGIYSFGNSRVSGSTSPALKRM